MIHTPRVALPKELVSFYDLANCGLRYRYHSFLSTVCVQKYLKLLFANPPVLLAVLTDELYNTLITLHLA
ncbi:MAG: hypothetical protein ACHQ0Y_13745, partial [Thermodesulfovibrionales bacterium]